MDTIKLVFPSKNNETAAKEYVEEHTLNGENGLHGGSGLYSAESYDEWLVKIADDLNREIRSDIFFAIRESDEKLIGTINVRYPYQGYVQIYGHIGYGVRPSERKKGYASSMLKTALDYCKEIGLEKVLLTCDKSNIASAKTITKCSGVFESESLQDDGEISQRYWIDLSRP